MTAALPEPQLPERVLQRAKERAHREAWPDLVGMGCALCGVPEALVDVDIDQQRAARPVCWTCSAIWAEEISAATDMDLLADDLHERAAEWFLRQHWEPPQELERWDGWYSDYLTTPAWRRRRLEALELAGHRCESCGNARRRLDVHHLTYDRAGREEPDDLMALCRPCHKGAHDLEDVEDDGYFRGLGRSVPRRGRAAIGVPLAQTTGITAAARAAGPERERGRDLAAGEPVLRQRHGAHPAPGGMAGSPPAGDGERGGPDRVGGPGDTSAAPTGAVARGEHDADGPTTCVSCGVETSTEEGGGPAWCERCVREMGLDQGDQAEGGATSPFTCGQLVRYRPSGQLGRVQEVDADRVMVRWQGRDTEAVYTLDEAQLWLGEVVPSPSSAPSRRVRLEKTSDQGRSVWRVLTEAGEPALMGLFVDPNSAAIWLAERGYELITDRRED